MTINLAFFWFRCGCSFRPKDHLGASENADSLSSFLVNHIGFPNLRVPSSVNTPGGAKNMAFACRTQVIGIGLDRREALGAIWQVRNTPIPCRCVGHRDESACMQVTIGSQQASGHNKQRVDLQLSYVSDHHTEQTWQIAFAKLIEVCLVKHGLFSESVGRNRLRNEPTQWVLVY